MRNLSVSAVVSAVRRQFIYFIIVFIILPQARALELGAEGEPLSLDVHAFASQGFIVTTDNNYLMESKRGSFEFTEVGINFTKNLNERLRMGLQLFARKLGTTGAYRAITDWFYLDYRFSDSFGIRAGRLKLPFGLYNDTSDIDAARVPILLPQSIYPIGSRDYLLAQSGGELYGRFDLRSVGHLAYRVYGGQIYVENPANPGAPIQIVSIHNPYIVGGRLIWETPLGGLRFAGSLQALRLDTELSFSTSSDTAAVDIPAVLDVFSVEYAAHNWLLAAEYSRWYVSADSHNERLFPSISTITSERGYAMASYRVNNWFQPGMYYSILYPNVDNHTGRENKQHDLAATVRFDINPFWLVKLEGHYMHGTAGLSSSLNNDAALSTLEENWYAFLIKTTVYSFRN